MDDYYSDLATLKLHEATKALTEAMQYAQDAKAPSLILINLKKIKSGINNRINDILILRKPRKK